MFRCKYYLRAHSKQHNNTLRRVGKYVRALCVTLCVCVIWSRYLDVHFAAFLIVVQTWHKKRVENEREEMRARTVIRAALCARCVPDWLLSWAGVWVQRRECSYGIRCFTRREFGLCVLTIYSRFIYSKFMLKQCKPRVCVCVCIRRGYLLLAPGTVCLWKFRSENAKVCAMHTIVCVCGMVALTSSGTSCAAPKLLKHIIIQELNIIVALVINYLPTRFPLHSNAI